MNNCQTSSLTRRQEDKLK